MSFIFVYDGDLNELKVFDAERIKIDSKNTAIFRQKFENQHDQLKLFTISIDRKYLVCYFDSRMLIKLYRLSDQNEIASVPVNNIVTALKASREFVSLGLEKKIVLSHLIVDPLESRHIDRIKHLDSRLI